MYLQVLKAKFGLCQYIAQNVKTFSKRSAFYALDGLVDKIGDIKVTQRSLNNLIVLFAIFYCHNFPVLIRNRSSPPSS